MALMEAMSYGLPAIAFKCPCGPSEIIENGINGILVENKNINDFAYELQKLMKDEKLREETLSEIAKDIIVYNNTISDWKWGGEMTKDEFNLKYWMFYMQLENDFSKTFNYVEFTDDNLSTY